MPGLIADAVGLGPGLQKIVATLNNPVQREELRRRIEPLSEGEDQSAVFLDHLAEVCGLDQRREKDYLGIWWFGLSRNDGIDGLWPRDHPTYPIVRAALLKTIEEAETGKHIDSFMVAIAASNSLQAVIKTSPVQVTLLFLLPEPAIRTIIDYIDQYVQDDGQVRMPTLRSEEPIYVVKRQTDGNIVTLNLGPAPQ